VTANGEVHRLYMGLQNQANAASDTYPTMSCYPPFMANYNGVTNPQFQVQIGSMRYPNDFVRSIPELMNTTLDAFNMGAGQSVAHTLLDRHIYGDASDVSAGAFTSAPNILAEQIIGVNFTSFESDEPHLHTGVNTSATGSTIQANFNVQQIGGVSPTVAYVSVDYLRILKIGSQISVEN
jgi:hypothetical protein